MSIYVERGDEAVVLAAVSQALRARAARRDPMELERQRLEDEHRHHTDIVSWAEEHFYIVDDETGKVGLIRLLPHQRAVLRLAFSRLDAADPRLTLFPNLAGRIGHFPFQTIIYSSVRKSGKSTVAAIVARYIQELQTRFGEIYTLGNDLEQAKERSFKFLANSIRLTPGCQLRSGEWLLPDRYVVHKTSIECLTSGTVVKAISVDAAGEAGANPDLTVWTELWGAEREEARRFWTEVAPVPTKVDSLRLVETYAGFEGESELLRSLYDTGMAGRQLTAGELAEVTDTPLDAFEETRGDPAALVPVWVNEQASVFMYWDSGVQARRMPWQRGEQGRHYYRQAEQTERPGDYGRHHLNEWSGAESEFVSMIAWDACRDETIPRFEPTDKSVVILGVDAGTSGDNFGVVAVSRHHELHGEVSVRAVKKWVPPKGGHIDYSGPEQFLRVICQGGCALGHPQYAPFKREDCPACRDGNLVPGYKVYCIVYDNYQLEDMMQSFKRDDVVWCEDFDQGSRRLKADRQLYDMIIRRELHHDGNVELREHVANARAKLQKDEESTMRITKKAPERKVDLVIALSMSVSQCKYLLL